MHAQRADTFGDQIDGRREFGVLRLEHQMQRVEHRARHVPVEVVGLQVQRVRIGEQTREPVRDLLAILVADTDIDVLNCLFSGHDDSF